MNKTFLSSLAIGLITVACSDPNTIGLEVQPTSENIIISSATFDGFNFKTESEDSLRTDEALNLILGQISDPSFGVNGGSFYSQILLTENNTDLGANPTVDSVILSYTYSGYYGTLEGFENLEVKQIYQDLYKDSLYYSNSFQELIGDIDNIEAFNLSQNLDDPFLRIKLKNDFGQQILNLGADILKDNESFLQDFKGISLLAYASNTMLYLNPDGNNSYLKIFYHNDENLADTLSLEFELGGDAARINLFNDKNENSITEDSSRMYIQSMAGYKIKIAINNIDSIKSLLERKVINKVIMTFDIKDGSQSAYDAHEKLVLVRINEEGNNVFLSDFTIEGDASFGGDLENNKYEFNITRYFYQLLNNGSYTKELYLLPAGAAVNANRTILDKDIKLQIYYSEL